LAKKTAGKFVLRVEDTDVKRTVPGAEREIMDGLRWLGLEYDEGPDVGGPYGPYRQTERREIYTQHAQMLVNSGHAYPCFCTPDRLEKMRQEQQKRKEPQLYDGLCRRIDPDEATRRVASGERHVIRFKMPHEGTTVAHDVIRGDIVIENKNIDDYVLLKSDGLPTYHLAAMVDDHLMEITHVLRAAEWLSTLPLHVNIVRAFGWEEPAWVHLSLFLKPSGKGKLSKRDATDAIKEGHSVFVKDMQDLGFIPEGVLNWMVLMGWGVAEDDVLTLKDMIERFDLDHLNPSPAAINFTKLDHFNGTHIRMLSDADLAGRLKPFLVKAGLSVSDDVLMRVTPLVKVRLTTLDEVVDMAGFFFREDVRPDPGKLVSKDLTPAQALDATRQSLQVLEAANPLTVGNAEPPMRALVERLGLSAGQVFGILRVAVTGQKVSPPLFESMDVIGRDTVLKRVRAAINELEKMVG
ncbi:MAG TPA: glutamate--tRNA ligase, partial [Chloroflexota bacterium]